MQEFMTTLASNTNRVITLLIWVIAITDVSSEEYIRSLHILHSNDNQSDLQDFITNEEKVLQYSSIATALTDRMKNRNIETIHLTAGDIVGPGPYYNAAAEVPMFGSNGLGDIDIFNALEVDANGVGALEFNGGIDEFATLLARAKFPFLSVNLDFGKVASGKVNIGNDAMECSEGAGKVVKSCFLNLKFDLKVGIIGKSAVDFFDIVNDPKTRLPGLDYFGGRDQISNRPRLSAIPMILEQVDKLEAKEVDIIVLLDQDIDYGTDATASEDLRGVDIIVCAECTDGTDVMARKYKTGAFNLLRDGDRIGSSYPTIQSDMDGHFILVLATSESWKYIGNCIASFDKDGHVINIDKDSGPIATTMNAVELMSDNNSFASVTPPNQAVAQTLKTLQRTDLISEGFYKVGETVHVLNATGVGERESNLGRLVANSYLWEGQSLVGNVNVDFALMNGGAIRASIPGPIITRVVLQNSLAFNNYIIVKRLTLGQVIATVENAVSKIPLSNGRFPQVAGMFLAYDPTKNGLENYLTLSKTSRIVSLKIGDKKIVRRRQIVADPNDTFVLATNNFVGNGGDGYAAIGAAQMLSEREDITEQKFFELYTNYVLAGRIQMRDPPKDPRVKKFEEIRDAKGAIRYPLDSNSLD